MHENENPICPNCGAVMVKRELDGSALLDGTISHLDGYYCPNCDKTDTENKDD